MAKIVKSWTFINLPRRADWLEPGSVFLPPSSPSHCVNAIQCDCAGAAALRRQTWVSANNQASDALAHYWARGEKPKVERGGSQRKLGTGVGQWVCLSKRERSWYGQRSPTLNIKFSLNIGWNSCIHPAVLLLLCLSGVFVMTCIHVKTRLETRLHDDEVCGFQENSSRGKWGKPPPPIMDAGCPVYVMFKKSDYCRKSSAMCLHTVQ